MNWYKIAVAVWLSPLIVSVGVVCGLVGFALARYSLTDLWKWAMR